MRRGHVALLLLVTVAAFAGCTHPIAPAISLQGISDIDSFFWTPNENSLKLQDSSGNPIGALTFGGSSSNMTVQFLNYPIMNCIVNSDSVFASDFTTGSIFDLPQSAYFTALDTEIFYSSYPQKIAVSDKPLVVFLATDSGVYDFDPSVSASFQFADLHKDTTVNALVVNPGYGVFGSTNLPTGDILGTHSLTPPYKSWGRNPGSVPGLTVKEMVFYQSSTGPDTLYATVAGRHGIWSTDGTALNPLKQLPFNQSDSITALGKFQPTSSQFFVLFATASGQIGAYSLTSGHTVSPFTLPASAGAVHCFAATTNQIVAGTDNGIYTCTNINVNNWTQLPLYSATMITSIGVEGGNLIFISNGTVYKGTYSTATQLNTESAPLQVGFNAGMTWAVTAQNFDTLANNQFTPVPGLSYWPYVPGGLVLLRKNCISLNTPWRAGTLVTDNHRSWAITGRITNHFDSLLVTSTNSSRTVILNHVYSDVIAVQYANETPLGPRFDSIPYWVVYYAKNAGPVMFDKISANPTGPSGSILIERREISP